MPYTQCIDENSSLLIAAAEGRQEKANLREEIMAVSRRSFNQHARLTGLEHGASGNICGDPSEKNVLYHFRPVDLSLWEWYFRAEILLAYMQHAEYVAFLSFEAFFPLSRGRVLNKYPGRGHAQETCYFSLPSSLWRNQAQPLYWALYK